ncbi:oligosaccharide flippase family protein [Nocardioides alcanivorans]|uniref:oligosaccharide flippase family protein n=1 Tax=Nocardioides alcanivorans TaxID=2897352 RepID=UPI001F2E1B47|nr:oligosaccharide flippase family protein [Nocardioides alcanivorans]
MLKLDSILSAALVAAVVLPMTVMGAQAGILQGERRWAPLALLFLANGIPRLLLGTALLLWQPDTVTAMVSVAIGQWAPVIVGTIALRTVRHVAPERRAAREVLREALANSQALLAFFALTNVDVVVARNLLAEHDAGLYAGGLILTKAVLFLPQFIVVLAFPAMSTPRERRAALLRSMSAAAALGALATVGAWLLSGLALVFVGGQEYAEIEGRLWLFGLLGTALALLQVLIYSVVARQGRRSILVVWAALVALIAGGTTAGSVSGLLAVVITVDVLLVAVLLTISLLRLRVPAPEPDRP